MSKTTALSVNKWKHYFEKPCISVRNWGGISISYAVLGQFGYGKSCEKVPSLAFESVFHVE